MLPDIRGNPLCLTDGYNLSHSKLKINTDYEVSHIYNRKSGMILYGFHELVTDFLSSIKITKEHIAEAEEHAKQYGVAFPSDIFQRVVEECDGKIPLKVETLPEGTYCPAGTPFAQISNTVKGFGELVTWWEAIFLHAHFPATCATEALKMRRYLEDTMRAHAYPETFLLRFHSFGFRGHRSLEDAYWAGSAWALFLKGSDDFHITRHHPESHITSIPALAHKVVQQFDDEFSCFMHAIDMAVENGYPFISLVIDTYDTHNVISNWVLPLAQYAKKGNVHLVFRPDSGDVLKQTVDIHDVVKENSLDNVSVIVGEGMSLEAAKEADIFFLQNNVPLTFVNYGIGAGFYKKIERDTLGWAMKTAFSNGKPRMKFSEDALKRSTPGIIGIYRHSNDNMLTVECKDELDKANLHNEMEVIYEYISETKQVSVKKPEPSDVVAERALRNVSVQQQQLYIRNSSNIKNLIKDFKNIYKKRSSPY